jgi:hypothetical protein
MSEDLISPRIEKLSTILEDSKEEGASNLVSIASEYNELKV